METTNYYKASISILIQNVACHLVLDYNQIDDDSNKKEMIHTAPRSLRVPSTMSFEVNNIISLSKIMDNCSEIGIIPVKNRKNGVLYQST